MDEAMKVAEETMAVSSSSKEGLYLGIAGLLVIGGTFVAGFVTGRATANKQPKDKSSKTTDKEAGEDEFVAEDDEVFE